MTLNLTVTTPRCIYQSADYRLIDIKTGRATDFQTQKIIIKNAFSWSAIVCFSGVGRTNKLDVGEWLAARMDSVSPDDPFERLLEELVKANDWLSTVPAPYNKHTFSVGAFIGSDPVFVLVSNFEQPSGLVAPSASPHLSIYKLRPAKPRTFVSGQRHTVTRPERRRLAALAAQDPEPQRMYSAIAEVNRNAATRSALVSSACFTAHVRLTGEGGGSVHDIDNRPFLPRFAFPEVARDTIMKLINQQFGPGRARLVGLTTMRAEPTEEYHQLQLREKPNDASTHSNYGVFLKENKGETEGAEQEYRKAIELDGNHINALGNLANLLWEKGEKNQAASLYQRVLESAPGHENVTWNYVRFLLRELDDRDTAQSVLDRGINTHPESGRLHLLQGELNLLDVKAEEALESFRRARETGAEQAGVESGYAFALHVSGAPIGECISAYWVALELNPKDAALRLNLAQLLFIKGNDVDAYQKLQESMRLGLDESAQLEAEFYLVAHTSSDPAVAFRTIKSLLSRGARLRWNVQPNIELVSRYDPQRAMLLELVAQVMRGEKDQLVLDSVLARW